jgi:hypothetical protein
MLVLSMTVVIGSMALAIDGGNAVLEHRRMQQAADAAALAGAQALALGGSTGQAQESATQYAVAHNSADSVDIAIEGGDTVTAIARSTSPTIFRGVLGRNNFEAAARAVAAFGPVGWVPDGVLPIVVHEDNWMLGAPIDIYAGGGPGNFGWLGWAGDTSSPALCDSLTYPYNSETYTNPYDGSDHILSVGDWVPGSTGVSPANCIEDALDSLLGTFITVPIWNQAEDTGANTEYHIVGFAKFELTDYRLPSENRITGRFVRWTRAGVGTTTGPGFGLYSVVLTE